MRKWDKLKFIEQNGIVAVIRKIELTILVDVINALVSGGIKVIEITVDSDNSYQSITKLKEKYGDELLVGAGTVFDVPTAKTAIDAGADFIFSPTFNEETIQMTNQYGRISIPGVLTPTEILNAYAAGADILKVFPGAALGTNYFKDVLGPLTHIPLMPTGGVNLTNLKTFLNNGAMAVGIGSSLLDKELITNRDFNGIQSLANQYVTLFKEVKEIEN
ncbi:bifunctional 4-hydroxy-2-oxoglutarate aldolase/2-dehydro-3-deoxy-phosphogluconate aldolase [Ureibacillus chungkukjangi]|uniref:bifunctional 4-hydroxy-2-oxoglutarate aldolase/2-dehydro-3-deoxy-phosphogluconate aldolase n=1 Tax=Ureibacillus chungkukjangi TaxID=1202712 RepID=UPI00203C040D|nr:bifunctional 4-hydroxy-2-oxoglutarate aldolase/2-dehydro-3-deoxy-phosphogluconate aldolase [Ureibacillus chungkukjangi]MCM3387039.1 bifunctional 4-hydroxy-2-oxoglutarate aldolase/2-dehydro-3-deoxy-phosphogluconate aldolase [Ureibacillus chungkukjangi]